MPDIRDVTVGGVPGDPNQVVDSRSNAGLSSTVNTEGSVIYQRTDVEIGINSIPFRATDISVNTNRYSVAGIAEIEGLYDGEGRPEVGEEIFIEINSERIFTGQVYESSWEEGDLISIKAFDAIKSFIEKKVDFTFERVPLPQISQALEDELGIPIIFDDTSAICPGVTYNDKRAIDILDQIAYWSYAVWWLDAYGNIHIREPNPTIHHVGPEFIEQGSNVGMAEIPYTKVKVIGQSPASKSAHGSIRGGERSAHMLSKNSLVATAGEGDEVYRHESSKIRTYEQAQNTAEAILDEFKRQRGTGELSIVGEGAPIRPFDVIRMPESFNNEQYLVSSIKHIFTNDDGYISDIQCGGYIDG